MGGNALNTCVSSLFRHGGRYLCRLVFRAPLQTLRTLILNNEWQITPPHQTKMKFRVFLQKLSNPRVRKRLKIGLSVWGVAIIISLIFKFAYDIGYFKAQSLINNKNTATPNSTQVLTLESAQRIVSGALKEDFNNPKTVVTQVIDNNQKLSTIIVENNKQKQIGWIIDMRLFFTGALFNDNGYNLTESLEYQHNINNRNR